MRTSEQIKAEIEEKLGFFPPFFSPALQNSQVLENLWHQTMNAYLNNPLSALFKEKLSAYLSRFCAVPYCLICHSCSLYSLGMQAREVLELLESPLPTEADIDEHLSLLAAQPNCLTVWPSNSALEKSVLCCSIFIALERDQAQHCRNELRRLLGCVNYQHLVTFIAYVKACHVWMEAYPEVAYSADKRSLDHLDALVEEEPGLADFFRNYYSRVRREQLNWAEQLAASALRQRHEQELRKAAEENLRLARAIASVSDGVLITDPNQPDNPIIYSNPAFERITGYQPEEILGGNCRFLQGAGTDSEALSLIRTAIAQRREVKATLLNYRKNGQPFWNELKISPVFSDQGDLLYFVGIQTDITQRKQAEEALHRREQQFKALVENTPDLIIRCDRQLRYVYVNPAVERITGTRAQVFLGKANQELGYSKELCQLWDETLIKVFETGTEQAIEYQAPSVSGLLTFQSRVVPEFDKDGSIQYALVVSREISQLKQAEAALRQSEERFQLIARATNDAIWDWDLLTDAVWWNESVDTLFGYCASQVGPDASWWYEHIHPEDRERVVEGVHAAIASSDSFWSDAYRYSRADGSYADVLDRGYIIRDDKRKPVRMIGGMTDITSRKRAEEKIRFQAALLDITTDAILVRDLEDQILFWNQGASRLYGWQAEEVLGKKTRLLLNQEKTPQLVEAFKTAALEGKWQGELPQVTKGGKNILVESRWTLMRDEEEKPKAILVVNTDITERKQLEAQFLRAQRLESIGTLASGITHDLNNVLTPILISAQLLLQTQLREEKKLPLLLTIESSARRGAALVKQVLSFARGVEGKRTAIQLRHLISEIRQIVYQTFPKSIEVYTDISQDLWMVSGDATQLHQVLMNLCVNARDAMPHGGTLSLSAANKLIDESYARMNFDAQVGSYLVFTVKDTGVGMPPEVVERIFEPFFTTKELGKGTGLGLSTVLTIVKSHGGFLEVTSSVGKGTQISVYLPAIEAAQTLPTKDSFLSTGQGELILVVDDEAAIRETNKTSLETYNYRVLTANDGIEAIALYAQHKEEVSLVLVDMMMPLMDGATTIRTLQKINPDIKIIAVSGIVSNAQLPQFASAGIQAFLSKPYTALDLLKTIDEVLSGKSKDEKGFVLTSSCR